MVTDYVTIFLMFIKLVYGFRYLKSVLFQGSMDEKYIMQKEGKENWDIRQLSSQRKRMQDYYMVSTGFQRFTFVQSICLFLIFFDKLMISLKISLLLIYSIIAYFYTLSKMEQLLEQMNEVIKEFYLKKHKDDSHNGHYHY
jgi:hypothetical protein